MRESFLSQNECENTDNYAAVCEKWRKIFQEKDKEELIARFDLAHDAQALYITYYNENYRLDRETGMLTLANDPDRVLPFNTVMSIYNLFHYSKPGAKIKGEFVPFRLVKKAAPFDPAFQSMILKPLAATFSGCCALLEKACVALKGDPVRQGDVGYIIQAFSCMPVMVVFWDGDDEFDAAANILFDADITDFLHEETVCCVASDLARRLAEEAGFGKIKDLLSPSL